LKDKNAKTWLWPLAGFAASALLLTVIQLPVGWSFFAWVALVPFVLASRPAAKLRHLLLGSYLVGLLYWLANLYWIFPITIIGWVALCAYTALLWPMVAAAITYCRQRNWPLTLFVPILFVGAERLQGFFLGGFFWRFLAHSQYANITIIQIADVFGAAGVSFVIAMVNGLVAELISAAFRKRFFSATILLKTACACAVLAAVIVYGRWRIAQWARCTRAGPVVAVVQTNVPQSVKRTFEASDKIFQEMLQLSKQSTKAHPDLIVWPETMVQASLNRDVWPFLASPDVLATCRKFDRLLTDHARDNADLLVGAYARQLRQRPDGSAWLAGYNSAFLYSRRGFQATDRYDKIHLVPFGEYIPLRKTFPSLVNFIVKLTPYNYDYSLEPGTQYTVFETTPAEPNLSSYRFGVMICYEDTVPAVARRLAAGRHRRKQLDLLVNISNDGWFVRFKHAAVRPSTELAQHAAVCAFRAVENRVPIVRSVNTGISCVIDSLGRIKDGFIDGNLPEKAMARQGVAGWFADEVPIDTRVTLFSRFGRWLDAGCAMALVAMVLVAGRTARRASRRPRAEPKKT